jgi:hypothetical protein
VKTPLDGLALLNAQGLVTFREGITLAAAQAMQHATRELFATFVNPQRRA